MSVQRPNYFTGQFLKEGDFLLEQDYHRKSSRMHNQHLHTNGVAGGLLVKHEIGTMGATVSPGMAIDPLGRTIVVGDTGALLNFGGKLRIRE